jgi:glycosyltransferase involved in cell wall biosynthesis
MLGVDYKKIAVIPTGVTIAAFSSNMLAPINATDHADDGISLGYVGRLDKWKNVSTLIQAIYEASKYLSKPLNLIIAGDGPERTHLESIADQLKVKTTFLGFVNDIPKVLQSIDIFVLPSLSEGSPLSLIEAMAAGKPIITSKIPAIQEIIENDREGLLIDPNNEQELCNAIIYLCNDQKKREELGNMARKRAKQFDLSISYEKLIQIFYGI